jgi:hypothetical protein
MKKQRTAIFALFTFTFFHEGGVWGGIDAAFPAMGITIAISVIINVVTKDKSLLLAISDWY